MKRVTFVATVSLALVIALTLGAHAQQPDLSASTVSVVGQVNQPGVYRFEGDRLTVVQALALARGLTSRADKKAIEITHKNGEKVTIDLDALMRGSVPNLWLKTGDVVRVPEMSK